MATSSSMAFETGSVLIFSMAALGGKPVTQPLKIWERGQAIAFPEIQSAISILDSQGNLLVDQHTVDKDGRKEDSLMSFAREEVEDLLDRRDPEAILHRRQFKAPGISGCYTHNTVRYGLAMIPVGWGTVRGEAMFRRTRTMTLEDAALRCRFAGDEEAPLVRMWASGWVITDELGQPLISLPYQYPSPADSVKVLAEYRKEFRSHKALFLDRMVPEGVDPWEPFVAQIPCIGDQQSPSEALNAYTGLMDSKHTTHGMWDELPVQEPADEELVEDYNHS